MFVSFIRKKTIIKGRYGEYIHHTHRESTRQYLLLTHFDEDQLCTKLSDRVSCKLI